MARACLERISKRQRAQCGVPTGAATRYDQPLAVDLAAVSQITSAVHTIVDVDDAPSLVKSLTILPAITGAATVVHVEHRESPAGPILDRKTQSRRSGRGWPTMTLHNQRRLFVRRRSVIGVLRLANEAVRREPAFGRKLDGARH